MEFKIESGIPIAPNRGGGGRARKYPWRELEVGQSFTVPLEQTKSSIHAQAYDAGKVLGKKFVCRKIAEEGVYRIWRIA